MSEQQSNSQRPTVPSAHEGMDFSHMAPGHAQQADQEATSSAKHKEFENGIDAPLICDLGDENQFKDAMQLSRSVPIVLQFWAEWCGPCRQLSPILESLVNEYGGRFQLAKVNIDHAQSLAQAFQVQSVPMVFALVAGQPFPLFQGALPKEQIKQYLEKLLQAAAQAGVTATISGAKSEPEPTEEERAVTEAIEAGDFDTAEALLEKQVENHPKRSDYKAALSQVRLQKRLRQENDDAKATGAMDDSDPLVLADQFMAAGNSPAAYQVLLDAIKKGREDACRGTDLDESQKADDGGSAHQGSAAREVSAPREASAAPGSVHNSGSAHEAPSVREASAIHEAARQRMIELFSIDTNTEAVSQARRKLSDILFS